MLAVVGPWSAWASRREQSFVPITDGGTTTLFVGTYLPGHGTIFGLEHAVATRRSACAPRSVTRPSSACPRRSSSTLSPHAIRSLTRDAAISAELHRNLRVYLLGQPVAFARMLAAKAWRMSAFPFQGTFRRAGATTIWLHRVLVAARARGLLAGLIRRRSAILGLALLTLGVTAALDIAFMAEARHAFRLMPALLAAGAGGWAMLSGRASASRPPPAG